MARKPRVHDTVTAEEPERVPVHEAPWTITTGSNVSIIAYGRFG